MNFWLILKTNQFIQTLKRFIFVTTLTKIKRFFMGALVGALFTRNTNKINNKQRVNRGYDSESGTTIQRTQPMAGFLLLWGMESWNGSRSSRSVWSIFWWMNWFTYWNIIITNTFTWIWTALPLTGENDGIYSIICSWRLRHENIDGFLVPIVVWVYLLVILSIVARQWGDFLNLWCD